MLVRGWRGEGVSGHHAGLRGESECWCGGGGVRVGGVGGVSLSGSGRPLVGGGAGGGGG